MITLFKSQNRQQSGSISKYLLIFALLYNGSTWAIDKDEEEILEEVLFSDSFTRDWGGLRTYLYEQGISVDLSNTTDILSNIHGGVDTQTTVANMVELGLSIDTNQLFGWKGGRFYFMFLGTYGADEAKYTGTVHTPSNIAAEDAIRVYEAWYEQAFWGDRFAILVGKYGVDAEFDAKSTADIFVNGGFGTGLDLSETGRNGPSIFPNTSFGTRLRISFSEYTLLRLAILDGVPDNPDDTSQTSIQLDDGDGLFLISELEHTFQGFQFFRVALGGWHYTTDFDDLTSVDSNGDPEQRNGTSGIYAFAEGVIFSEDDESQGLSGYVRIGGADEDVNQFDRYYGGGLVYTGLIPGRNQDVLGIGISIAVNGSKYRTAAKREGISTDNAEKVLELTYSAAVLPWLNTQPTVQYAMDPGTDPSLDNSLVVGVRIGVGL